MLWILFLYTHPILQTILSIFLLFGVVNRRKGIIVGNDQEGDDTVVVCHVRKPCSFRFLASCSTDNATVLSCDKLTDIIVVLVMSGCRNRCW